MNKYQEAYEDVELTCLCIDNAERAKEYLSVIKELVERTTPKKPTEILLRCPNCNHKIGFDYYMGKHVDYCPTCGQALDWSEEE